MLGASEGQIGETLRLYVPEPIVAFGKQDVRDPNYPEAVAAARRLGYVPVERLAGGRAAVFHPGTIAFAWTVPDPRPAERIHARFAAFTSILVAAFASLGLEAHVGEIPGEYCPGEYSINLGKSIKVAGIGQRLIRHAAHVGGVVVVTGGALVRDVLVPVYDALGLAWNPATAGALEDVRSGTTVDEVQHAIVSQIANRVGVEPVDPHPELVARAERLQGEHVAP